MENQTKVQEVSAPQQGNVEWAQAITEQSLLPGMQKILTAISEAASKGYYAVAFKKDEITNPQFQFLELNGFGLHHIMEKGEIVIIWGVPYCEYGSILSNKEADSLHVYRSLVNDKTEGNP